MPPLGRAGAWRSRAVERMTTLLLLRLRFTLTTSGRTNRLLLGEEAAGLAFAGLEVTSNLAGLEALALLEPEAAGNRFGSTSLALTLRPALVAQRQV
jgi:hypothetical protein